MSTEETAVVYPPDRISSPILTSMPVVVRHEIVNYPVGIGGIVEVLAASQSQHSGGRVLKFRLVRFCGIHHHSVMGVVVPEDGPTGVVGGEDGLVVHFGYDDVVLPFIYMCIHPVAL
jgi:hypothetical protein